jgi:hypothetical protein
MTLIRGALYSLTCMIQLLCLLAIVDIARSFTFHQSTIITKHTISNNYATTKSYMYPRPRLMSKQTINIPVRTQHRQTQFCCYAATSNSNGNGNEANEDEDEPKSVMEEELERLQQTLTSIEALEERNKAQLDSFVDEEDQWNSLEDDEQELLDSKERTAERLEKMTEELLQMWIGAKSMDG